MGLREKISNVCFASVTSCGALPQPQNGQLTSLSNGIGDVVTVTCSTCHAMSQTSNHTVSMTTECLPSGSWTSQPQCQVVTCPVLEPYKGKFLFAVRKLIHYIYALSLHDLSFF